MIYRGETAPGERLNPDLLASQLQISKTPVRDALQALKVEGLVDIVPRVGVFVRRMSHEEAADVYRLKQAIEPMAAALAAERGDAAERTQLRAMLPALRSAVKRGNVAKAEEAVNSIHQQLFDMSRSEVLRETFRVVNGRVRLLRHENMAQSGRLEVTLQHHEQLIGAVVAGDPDESSRLMAAHLIDAAQALQRALAQRQASAAS